uniref:Uncharacterized protein n=1 Tax=Trichuris muris TaxID=70415 RepID=A0A5S6QZ54_TRIMR
MSSGGGGFKGPGGSRGPKKITCIRTALYLAPAACSVTHPPAGCQKVGQVINWQPDTFDRSRKMRPTSSEESLYEQVVVGRSRATPCVVESLQWRPKSKGAADQRPTTGRDGDWFSFSNVLESRQLFCLPLPSLARIGDTSSRRKINFQAPQGARSSTAIKVAHHQRRRKSPKGRPMARQAGPSGRIVRSGQLAAANVSAIRRGSMVIRSSDWTTPGQVEQLS